MFDIAFSELVIIAVVALVVIGPERLPTVARTVGALLGRLNRYVSDVKADVEREMRLEEMKKLRAEVEAQASGIEQEVVRGLEETRLAAERPMEEVRQSLDQVVAEAGAATASSPAELPTLTGDVVPAASASSASVVAPQSPGATDPVKT